MSAEIPKMPKQEFTIDMNKKNVRPVNAGGHSHVIDEGREMYWHRNSHGALVVRERKKPNYDGTNGNGYQPKSSVPTAPPQAEKSSNLWSGILMSACLIALVLSLIL
jgi:hypothetical protein